MEKERRILITIVYPPPTLDAKPTESSYLPSSHPSFSRCSFPSEIDSRPGTVNRRRNGHTHRRRWENGATAVVVGKIGLAFLPSFLPFPFPFPFSFFPTRTEGRKKFVPCFSKGRKAGRIAGANCSQERAGRETSASLFAHSSSS